MTVKEENVLMRFKDNAGNETKVYPITRKENVVGLDKGLSSYLKAYDLDAINVDSTAGCWTVDISDLTHGTVPEAWVNVTQTSSGHFLVQTAIKTVNSEEANRKDSRMWVRNKYIGGVWSAWEKVYSESQTAPADDVGLFVQPNEPTDAADGSVWVDTDDVGISDIDGTLTLSGYAADAKVTGTKIAGVENNLSTLESNTIGAGSYEYQGMNGGDANELVTDQHRFVYNVDNTAFAYGLLDVRRSNGLGFSPNDQTDIIHQTMRDWNTTNIAHRVSTDAGATWSAWSTTGVVNLWYNSNPKEDFEGQTITFNSDGYRFLVICFKNYKSLNAQKTMTIMPNSDRTYGMTGLCVSGSPPTFTLANRVFDKTSTGIKFKDAYISGDSETHNEYCIPWIVYGIGF